MLTACVIWTCVFIRLYNVAHIIKGRRRQRMMGEINYTRSSVEARDESVKSSSLPLASGSPVYISAACGRSYFWSSMAAILFM